MIQPRRAIVVGGAGGIGGATVHALDQQGYRTVVADFDFARAQKVLDQLQGKDHEAVRLDVTEPQTIVAAFDAIEASDPASILVIASGGPTSSLEHAGTIATAKLSDWDKALALNLTGVFNCLQAFARLRLAAPLPDARVVIVGSTAGHLAGNGTDVAYSVSKAGLLGLARQAAVDLAPAGITVNIVSPGPVATPELFRNTNEQIRTGIAALSVFKRLATLEEVGAGIVYLLSREAAFITGATLDINGGSLMR
ncbi:SDR family NAD(P)-dependent oxidoreductase [Agrobacterium deltaense]|uniref:SDR family NAD(P)-dependent oxidoreductase n=1 Tax=Agrobacterium deltaense TaxID=1183412 RepID=UPI0009BA8F84|nr:SDR family oxidoreductase [Agrobacterium deltaense]CUX56480.1 conserved exported hypothetical protein [Agrobacterium deltaense RV3]